MQFIKLLISNKSVNFKRKMSMCETSDKSVNLLHIIGKSCGLNLEHSIFFIFKICEIWSLNYLTKKKSKRKQKNISFFLKQTWQTKGLFRLTWFLCWYRNFS